MSWRRKYFKFVWQSAAIAVVACIVVLFASRYTAFMDLDAWTFDFTSTTGGDNSVSKDIVLVDIDEESFARIGKYPIPWTTVADLVTKIGAQHPKIVGMDMLLSEARTPEDNQAMQAALTSAGVVIVASQTSEGGLPPELPLLMFCQPENAKAASGFCPEGAPGAEGYAFINLPFDQDGYIRQMFLIYGGPPPSESFPLFLAEQYSGSSYTPIDRNRGSFLGHTLYFADSVTGSVLIGSWSHQPVTTIPAWKLLAGAVPPDALTGKLVLIGQTNDAAHDRLLTPVFRHAEPDGRRLRLGGTEVLAAAIRSLLEGKVVRPANPLVRWTTVLLVCWLSAFLILALRTSVGVGFALVLAALPSVLAVWLYAKYRYWLPFLPVQAGVGIALPMSLGLQYVLEQLVSHEAREQRKQLMKLFSSYVDPAVANTIWDRRSEVSLSGEERIATVVFTDIRNFTKMSAGRPPAEVLRWLNQYLTAMDQVIRRYDGFLNKFIGDGLMIIFGLPLSHGPSEDARLAVEASLAMLEAVTKLNELNAGNPEIPQLRIGIGMHTGSLMAGSIGSASRQEYSVIGSTVNLASRLESLNKPFKTEILMSQATRDMIARDFVGVRSLGMTSVAGLEEQIEVFTVDPQPKPEPKYRALIDRNERVHQ
ncbi:CHASE2 domain-containing protein [Granulicella aggregans]|uniref:CHASE2 domain-containing protein n=1 Tax=Granulicella aggregans TaxID=474949 RepID=UPI0021E0E2B8|nr:adenylate/guanylate cyclase domain-containing protein [Granulicella aggregans]